MADFGNIRKLPSGRFQARYMHQGVVCKAPNTFQTKALAQGWLNSELKLITFDEWIPPSVREVEQSKQAAQSALEEMTVAGLIDDWLGRATNLGESTRRSHRKRLQLRAIGEDMDPRIESLGPLRVVDVDRARIRLWVEQMLAIYPEGTDGYSTCYYARKRLSTAFEWAVKELGLITENPVVGVSMRKPTVVRKDYPVFSVEEAEAICDAFPAWLRHAAEILLWCGLRPSEAVELRVKDVVGVSDGEAMELRIRRSAVDSPRKSGRGKELVIQPIPKTDAGRREVAVPPSVAKSIRIHLKNANKMDPEDLVISTKEGGQFAVHYLRDRYFNPARDAIGRSAEDSDMYLCRNFYGTKLMELVVQQKISLEEARRLMGHESTEQLMQYMRASRDYRERTSQALGDLRASAVVKEGK